MSRNKRARPKFKYRQGRPANADKIAEQEKEPSITATDNGGVRQAEFDAGQLDKNVRISYLRNMLMAKAQRKDRIKSGEITPDDMQQPIDKEEMRQFRCDRRSCPKMAAVF